MESILVKKVNFDQVSSSLQPLSCILFRGASLPSELILETESIVAIPGDKQLVQLFSHCGILVNTNILTCPNMVDDTWYGKIKHYIN